MSSFSISLIFLFFYFSLSSALIYNKTLTDFSQCRIHYSRQERSYTTFFHISDLKNVGNNGSLFLDFHFSVLAISDAHILLSPSSVFTNQDPVYEIVIGAGGNTFSDIRRKQKGDVRATVRKKGLLSAVDVRSFWIHIYEDGLIEVGIEGYDFAFLSWRDDDLLPISVISFSTWTDVEAKWFFDCPMEKDSSKNEKMKPNLTSLEKLRKDMFENYSSYSMPLQNDERKIITLKINSHHISLDDKTSILNVKGKMIVKWMDERIKWKSENYENITSMHVFHGEIWKPDFLVYNSISPDISNTFTSSMIVITKNGTAIWRPAFDINTFCDLDHMEDWPNDKHTCKIQLSFWNRDADHLALKFSNNEELFDSKYMNQWEVLEVDSISIIQTDTKSDVIGRPILELRIVLRRIAKMYHFAFWTPFYVVSTLMLISFLTSPFDSTKIVLISIQLILSTMVIITISLLMPAQPQSVPYLVYYYSSSFIGNVVTALIAIIVINLSRNNHQFYPPHSISKILEFKFVEKILCLPKIKIKSWKGNITKPSIKETWIRCGIAIDRVSFFIFFCLIFSTFFVKY